MNTQEIANIFNYMITKHDKATTLNDDRVWNKFEELVNHYNKILPEKFDLMYTKNNFFMKHPYVDFTNKIVYRKKR